jgi:hypothetical protein
MTEYKFSEGHLLIKDHDGFSRFPIREIQGVYPDDIFVTVTLVAGNEWSYDCGTEEKAKQVSGDIGRFLYDQF